MAQRDTSASELCTQLGIKPVTLYRYVGPQGQKVLATWTECLDSAAGVVGIPLIVNTSSGIMNTDSGHREHSPERSDGLASQFIPSESRFSLF